MGGRIPLAAISSIIYDVVKPLISGGARSSSQLGANASTVRGKYSGRADAAVSRSGSEYSGAIEFKNGFKSVQGLPELSGAIDLALNVQRTSSAGNIGSQNLSANGKNLEFQFAYNLIKGSNGLWSGTGAGQLTDIDGNQSEEITYNYDTPLIAGLQLKRLIGSNSETAEERDITGPVSAGQTVRLKVAVVSNAAPDWLSILLTGPTEIIEGGGSSWSYCRLGSCEDAPAEWLFRESFDHGYWIGYRDFPLPAAYPNGAYTWAISVRNAAQLTSVIAETSLELIGGTPGDKPVIQFTDVVTSGLGNGANGSATLRVVACSDRTINWLNRNLTGPAGNIEGGGSNYAFTSCSAFQTNGHPCAGTPSNCQYAERQYSFSGWAPNGTYTFDLISVKNTSLITSDPATGTPSFTITGNPEAAIPTITDIAYVRYNEDPLLDGVSINGACIRRQTAPDPLKVAIIITASSNAPVNWINSTLDGPTQPLQGGGSGVTFDPIGGGLWRGYKIAIINDPSFAPTGAYRWSGVSVQNAGEKQSATYAEPLSFTLANDCS